MHNTPTPTHHTRKMNPDCAFEYRYHKNSDRDTYINLIFYRYFIKQSINFIFYILIQKINCRRIFVLSMRTWRCFYFYKIQIYHLELIFLYFLTSRFVFILFDKRSNISIRLRNIKIQ